MAKTLNRKPVSFNTPSSGAVQRQFFSQYNWKGIDQNENFLAVDQETFSDANNVCINESGLLSSRPAVKHKYKFSEREVIDIISLGDGYYATTYVERNTVFVSAKLELGVNSIVKHTKIIVRNTPVSLLNNLINQLKKAKIFKVGPKIYFLSKDFRYRFNVNGSGDISEYSKYSYESDGIFYDAATRIYTGLDFVDGEENNLFSSGFRYQYLLPSSKDAESVVYGNKLVGSNLNYFYTDDKTRVLNSVEVDKDGDYIKLIHRPILYERISTYTINAYQYKVPLTFIYNHELYWYEPESYSLYRASLSDFVAEKICDISLGKVDVGRLGKFVKIRLQPNGVVSILYTECEVIVNLDDFSISYDGIVDSVIPARNINFLDVCSIDVGNKTYKLKSYVCELYDEEYNYTCFVMDFINVELNAHVTVKHQFDADVLNLSDCIRGNVEMYASNDQNPFSGFTGIQGASISLQLRHFYEPEKYKWRYLSDILFFPISYKDVYLNQNLITITNAISDDGLFKFTITDNKYGTFNSYTLISNGFYVDREGIFGSFEYGNNYYYGKLRLKSGSYNELECLKNDFTYAAYNKNLYYLNESGEFCTGVKDIGTDDNGDTFEYLREIVINKNLSNFTLNSDSIYWFASKNNGTVFTNYRVSVTTLFFYSDRTFSNYITSDFNTLLIKDKLYVSIGSKLYIGSIILDDVVDGERFWFKKSMYHDFTNKITGLHSISEDTIAVFTENDIWYVVLSEGVYYYNKSKIIPTLKGNSDIITLSDSSTTLFPSNDGITAMSYQNFVASEEQSTTDITQNIKPIYKMFTGDIKIVNWRNYTIFYQEDKSMFLVFDRRNMSWWKWIFNFSSPIKLLSVENELYIMCKNDIYSLSFDQYADEYSEGNFSEIHWDFESQKLHLNANNAYKHIDNITLSSVEKSDDITSLNLSVKNYRKYVDNGKPEIFEYDIDVVRTYVKKLNYAKVNEFQYKLSSNDNVVNKSPLSLSNIGIKYRIGGYVR